MLPTGRRSIVQCFRRGPSVDFGRRKSVVSGPRSVGGRRVPEDNNSTGARPPRFFRRRVAAIVGDVRATRLVTNQRLNRETTELFTMHTSSHACRSNRSRSSIYSLAAENIRSIAENLFKARETRVMSRPTDADQLADAWVVDTYLRGTVSG